MRYFGASVKDKSSSPRWWDSVPVDISAINAKKIQVIKSVPKISVFEALAVLPGMQSLATKSPTQPKSGVEKMTVQIDKAADRAIDKAMLKMGLIESLPEENESPQSGSLETALSQAHSPDVLHGLGVHHERDFLNQQSIQVYFTDSFPPDLKLAAGFAGGSFATRLSSGQQVICLDLDDCRSLSKALNLSYKAVAQVILCHEYGHLLALKAGHSATDEQLAWNLAEHFGQPLLHGTDHGFTSIRRHLLQQQAAA